MGRSVQSAAIVCAVAFTSSPSHAVTDYATDFDLTEKPISEGGAWKHTGLDWTPVMTAGGLAHGTQTGTGGYDDSYAYLSGFPPDQAAAGVVHLDAATSRNTTHEVEILLRWTDGPHFARGYECNFAYNGEYADIVRWNGARDDYTYLVPTGSAGIPGGLHDGDVISAQIVGRVITTFVNGVPLLSTVDGTFDTGNPGMGFFRGGPSAPASDFAFTRFTATSVTRPVPWTTLIPPRRRRLAGFAFAALALLVLFGFRRLWRRFNPGRRRPSTRR
jgi:hypothetical protein